MRWTRDNVTTDSPGRSAFRAAGEAPSRRASPLHPKTGRNGEASVVGGAVEWDVTCDCATGCGNPARHRKRLCFTTWASAAVTVGTSRKLLPMDELRTVTTNRRHPDSAAVVKRFSVFGVRNVRNVSAPFSPAVLHNSVDCAARMGPPCHGPKCCTLAADARRARRKSRRVKGAKGRRVLVDARG